MRDFNKYQGGWVHKLANIAGHLTLGEWSRVDAYVTVTGDVVIGKYCHVGTGACLFGGSGITLGDYAALSPGAMIFSATEDVSGEWVTNPTVPDAYRNPVKAHIVMGDHAEIGARSILLPGAHLPEGAFLGSLSMCKKALEPWSINAGVPAVFKKSRTRGVLAKVKEFECQPT